MIKNEKIHHSKSFFKNVSHIFNSILVNPSSLSSFHLFTREVSGKRDGRRKARGNLGYIVNLIVWIFQILRPINPGLTQMDKSVINWIIRNPTVLGLRQRLTNQYWICRKILQIFRFQISLITWIADPSTELSRCFSHH